MWCCFVFIFTLSCEMHHLNANVVSYSVMDFLMISWGLQLMSLSDGSNGEIRGNDEEKKLETLLQPACLVTDPDVT